MAQAFKTRSGWTTVILTALAVLLGSTNAAHADTYVALKSQPSDYIGLGQTLTLTPDDGTFTAHYSAGSVSVAFSGADHF